MPHCQHCDAFVSQEFVRVFSDAEDRVLACPNCSANAGISRTLQERRASGA